MCWSAPALNPFPQPARLSQLTMAMLEYHVDILEIRFPTMHIRRYSTFPSFSTRRAKAQNDFFTTSSSGGGALEDHLGESRLLIKLK